MVAEIPAMPNANAAVVVMLERIVVGNAYADIVAWRYKTFQIVCALSFMLRLDEENI